jgi:predicted phosphodiesterase
MKTVIFSDTHLSGRVQRKKFHYLMNVIESADRVIIAGDLWDGFLTDFDGFLRSGWRRLFQPLLDRKAVYLYGNHDRIEWSDDRVKFFSVEQHMEVGLQVGSHKFLVTHGDTIHTSLEMKFPVILHPSLQKTAPLRVAASVDILHKIVFGKRFLNKENNMNAPMIQWAREKVEPPTILVCGHSHYPEFLLEDRYINLGFNFAGFGSYLLIENDTLELVREKY